VIARANALIEAYKQAAGLAMKEKRVEDARAFLRTYKQLEADVQVLLCPS
jgi:hypothetical protein